MKHFFGFLGDLVTAIAKVIVWIFICATIITVMAYIGVWS